MNYQSNSPKIFLKKKESKTKSLPKYAKPVNEKTGSIISIKTSPNINWYYHR